MKNIFKKLFQKEKKKEEFVDVPSFKILRSFFNQVGRKRLIEALPNDEKKAKLTELIHEGFIAINSNTKQKQAKHLVDERLILGLTKIYLTYGKKIKIKQKK